MPPAPRPPPQVGPVLLRQPLLVLVLVLVLDPMLGQRELALRRLWLGAMGGVPLRAWCLAGPF